MGIPPIEETPQVGVHSCNNCKGNCQCEQFKDVELQEDVPSRRSSDDSLQSVDINKSQENLKDIKNKQESTEDVENESRCKHYLHKASAFYFDQMFSIHLLIAIAIAKAYPPLGAEYLAPKITASWLAVSIIFFISGLSIKSKSLLKSFGLVRFHGFLQIYNFFFISAVILGVAKFLAAVNVFEQPLADGLVICGCLPMAVNAIIVFSVATGANEPAAVFNATFSNVVGIFLSPILMLGYLGTKSDMPLGEVFWKLILRVVVPLIVGQIFRNLVPSVKAFYSKYKVYFKRTSESCLVFVIYTVFCTTFKKGTSVSLGQVFGMLLCIVVLTVSFMTLSWFLLRYFYPKQPELCVVGLVGGSQKTISMGVPLITSVYQGNPNLALYTLPILIYHPVGLFLCSFITQRLTQFIVKERKRIDALENRDSFASADIPNDKIADLTKGTGTPAPSTPATVLHQETLNSVSDDSV